MKGRLAATALLSALLAGGWMDASAADIERGRALYENHCTVCHTPKIHTRPNRLPLNFEGLRRVVVHWAKEENLHWSEAEIDDVVWYLNQTKYKY